MSNMQIKNKNVNMKKLLVLPLCAALLCVFLFGCALQTPAPEAEQKDGLIRQSAVGFYFDTVITLIAYDEGQEALDNALIECGKYEALLSKTVQNSDVWRINHAKGQPVEVDPRTIEILKTALEISALSEGVFDITIAPAVALWDFTGEPLLPDANKLKQAASRVDYTKLKLEGNTVTLPEGMSIDLGSIAKGYIADQIALFLQSQGIAHASLSLGGNIVSYGGKPDGSDWIIGVQDPDASQGVSIGVIKEQAGSIVTSGIYERGFDLNGVRYHHILDPKTGMPFFNDLASITIFSESSMLGDALSTACFALPYEKSLALLGKFEGTEAIFIYKDRTIKITDGLKDKFLVQ